ncbi:DUF642 domain-containing protein [Actinosynnema sp. NPDC047251]|uniref:DUF642 domain-containing protein n=1 Tax=Saccharothrix espanaensis (strain ATCC 51144 / DSM 44229 / JCM 9112 / NBRC 15066 / NRRL 15764) TaxID=1179773 RepID=K0JUC7_SACES|nr:DUF642 domain-containing protein [Saccharothrix espanaensis]CCH29531.1 hypothetical protein BN6_22100 [Saccharothrix espanaensis DSM 44229]
MAVEIENPAFARPAVDPAREFLTITGPDGHTIPGWRVTIGKVQLVPLGAHQRPRGNGEVTQALRLKEGSAPGVIGEIRQEVRTSPGEQVTLTWCESADITSAARSATNEQSYTVTVRPTAGGSVGPVVFYPGDDVRGPHWQSRSLDFVVSASVTTIEFRARIEGTQGPLIAGLGVIGGSPVPPVADLRLTQADPDPVEAVLGQAVRLNIEIEATTTEPVIKEGVGQVFTAPTGVVFTGVASYGYFGTRPPVTGDLNATVGDDGKTITVHDKLAINTSPQTMGAVTYTFEILVPAPAEPGTYGDGTAKVDTQSIPVVVTVR